MPSIAYRLAGVAAGDGDVEVSLFPVSTRDVVVGHVPLIWAGRVLLEQDGVTISYSTEKSMRIVSQRCLAASMRSCEALIRRDGAKVRR